MPSYRLPRGLAVRLPDVSAWPVWALSRPLRAYVLAASVAATTATAVAATQTTWRLGDATLFLILLVCAAVSVEAIRHVQEPHGGSLFRDLLTVWYLPAVILLPPVYALLAPLPIQALKHWRVQRGVVHRRVFTIAATGLSYGAASVTFHAFPVAGFSASTSGAQALIWTLTVMACAVLAYAINVVFILVAVRLSDPEIRLRQLVATRDGASADLVEVSFGVLVTIVAAVGPFFILFALPMVPLQRRFLLHSQLVAEARIDGKTGLFNAHTFEREAGTEVARASRTGTPLAVLLADIDHFKWVNDTFGHLAGDRVLRAVSTTLSSELREYDMIGRFGGEEFAILLPHTGEQDAQRTAERLRARISNLVVALEDARDEDDDPFRIRVTVSIGAATLSESQRELTELLAAADSALYRAKEAGRDRVRVVADR